MDIRSIIDSEDTPPTRKPSVSVPPKHEYRPSPAGIPSTQAPAYDSRHDARPPPPSPLQTPSHNGSHSTTTPHYENIHSSYQRAPSFGLHNGQYPPAQIPNQSPQYGHQAPHYPQREGSSVNGPPSGRSFGPSTPLSQTPTASTPGSASAYSTFQRPTSSHSVTTPNSAKHSSSFLRESPQPAPINSRTLSQPQSGQQYTSQPGTPLGPPSTYNRPSLNIHRESSGSYSHQRRLSGGIAGNQENLGPVTATRGSPSAYREVPPSVQGQGGFHERERSLSVSPKTKLPSLMSIDRMSSMDGRLSSTPGWSGQITPIQRKTESETPESGKISEPNVTRTPSRSVGVSGLLNAEPHSESPERAYRPSQVESPSRKRQQSDVEILNHNPSIRSSQDLSSSLSDQAFQYSDNSLTHHPSTPFQQSPSNVSDRMASDSFPQISPSTLHNKAASESLQKFPSQPEIASSFKQAALKTSNGLINSPLPPIQKTSRGKKQKKRPIQESSETEAHGNDKSLHSQPAKKKPRLEGLQNGAELALTQEPPSQLNKHSVPRITRWQDVPIYARSVRGDARTRELFEQNRKGAHRHPATTAQVPSAAVAPHSQTNGSTASHPNQLTNGRPPLNAPLTPTSDGPLGPWEYNIANLEPIDDVIRVISDFLFINVVVDDNVAVAPAGGGRGLGAIFEIEAKIGRIIDNNTNDRIRLPVETECVISRSDPSLKTRFESSMTQVSCHSKNCNLDSH